MFPPPFVKGSIQYEVITGSESYGCADTASLSDKDVVAWCMPPREILFPHLTGAVAGFGRQPPSFNTFQQHHMVRPKGASGSAEGDRMVYDVCVYNVVKYFHLIMMGNPNMIDSLYSPQRCILHETQLGELVRSNRKKFLHKGCYIKFVNYAYSQLHKAESKNPVVGSKREKLRELYGTDVKFNYNIVRLLDECEQILLTHDLDLERSRELLKSIRRGEWSLEQVQDHFNNKRKTLEEAFRTSTLPEVPNEPELKNLLLQCLESYYGDLSKAVVVQGREQIALEKIVQALRDAGMVY